jgi:hypothetical protein
MNLSEALSELKLIKGRIARLIALREQTISYNKDSTPPVPSFEEVNKELEGLYFTATKLKTAIAKANVEACFEDGKTICEAILEQGNIRSEIAAYRKIIGDRKERYEKGIWEDYTADNKKFQITRFQVEEKIRELENQKRKIDAKIQRANWSTKFQG